MAPASFCFYSKFPMSEVNVREFFFFFTEGNFDVRKKYQVVH